MGGFGSRLPELRAQRAPGDNTRSGQEAMASAPASSVARGHGCWPRRHVTSQALPSPRRLPRAEGPICSCTPTCVWSPRASAKEWRTPAIPSRSDPYVQPRSLSHTLCKPLGSALVISLFGLTVKGSSAVDNPNTRQVTAHRILRSDFPEGEQKLGDQ